MALGPQQRPVVPRAPGHPAPRRRNNHPAEAGGGTGNADSGGIGHWDSQRRTYRKALVLSHNQGIEQ